MATVADFAEEFARRARAGEKPAVRVKKAYAEAFFGELARQGFEFAKECLGQISDPELRRIIEAIFFSAAAGAVLGAAIGGTVAGAPGAKVGAVVGAGIGVVAGCVAVVLTAKQENGPDGAELVVAVS
jgi:hypothetical protein